MRNIVYILALILTTSTFAQKKEKELIVNNIAIPGRTFEIYVSNPTKHVISYEMKFKADGYKADRPLEFNDTIAPGTEKLVMEMKANTRVEDRTFSYDWIEELGNVFAKHDFNLRYTLPYEEGKAFEVIQGYDEGTTHRTIEALDFRMPVGTKVTVARRGLVTHVKQDSDTGCPDSSCESQANYIRVLHLDGTFGLYSHLKQNSAVVEVGDYVNVGDTLALSGATGQVSEPHLHFQVDRLAGNLLGYVTIPVKFNVLAQGRAKLLEKGDKVVRPYDIQ